jgi:hypothetical protein
MFSLVIDDFRRTSRQRGSAGLLAASLVLLAAGCSPPPTTSNTTGAGPTPTVTAPTPTVTAPTPTVTAPTPTVTAPTPTTTAPTPTTTTTPETPADVVGEWKSAPCGARKYERRITLAKDGSFTAQDLVSPCPKGVVCVWSGIIDTKGTWKQEGKKVLLTAASQAPNPKMGSPFPTTLTIDPATKSLIETVDGATCAYKR